MMSTESERPFQYVHQDVKRLRKIQKRFSFSISDKSGDTVAVYIRLKPNPDHLPSNFLSYDNTSNTLTIKKKTLEKMYKFTQIFSPETSQNQIFEECTKPYIKEFIEGQRNIFMFTYGASSSGKTYTVQGEPGDPGIIPRVIAVLIKSVEGSLETDTSLYPEQGSIVAELTPQRLNENNLQKSKILSLSKTLMEVLSRNNDFFLFSEFEDLKNKSEKMVLENENASYTLWFSYYEIYNEQVFDLLDDAKDAKQQLRVISDKNHTYIDGLRYIQINSIYEAYLIYSFGRYNLSISSTGINDKSSRSHSIFTIKIIGRASSLASTYFLHSSFAICDLAGTERINKTGNVGQRLKEAQRINSSFLTLNRCLRTIRYNQSSGYTRCVPYRESKLTKILGPSLTSPDTCLAMIVTVSQSEDLIEETESSLKASSVAATIKATTLKPQKPFTKGRFSNLVMADYINWNDAATRRSNISAQDESRRRDGFVLGNSANLANPICSEGSMPDVYKELEEERKKRKILEEKLTELEKYYKKEIERLENRRLSGPDENTVNLLQKQIEEQEEEFMASRTENLKLKKTIRIINEEKSKLDEKIKNLENVNQGLNEMLDDAKEEIEDLQNELNDLEKTLKEKEDVIVLKDEKLQSLESEILELEQNLENNASEIEAYDKQLMVVEKHLQLKKMEMNDIMNKYEALNENFKKAEEELVKLKEKYQYEKNLYTKELAQTKKLVETYENEKKLKCEINCQQHTPEKELPSRNWTIDSDYDDPTDVPYSTRKTKAKTTTKKMRRKKPREYGDVYSSSRVSLHETSNLTDKLLSSVKAKRKLFLQNSEDLSEPSDSLNADDESLPSPQTILKRTLRTGKYY